MDINKELFLIRNVILEEIDNISSLANSNENIEGRIKYLISLLKKTTVNYLYKFNHNEKLDIVVLITNMLYLLEDEIASMDNISDIASHEIMTLEILHSDYTKLLNKFVS